MDNDLNKMNLSLEEFNLLNKYWGDYALKNIDWYKKFDSCLIQNPYAIEIEFLNKWKWFSNGLANIKSTFFFGKKANQIFITSYNFNDLNKKEITYGNFLKNCSFLISQFFHKVELKKVMIIGSASSETATLMIASSLAGKCHCVLFEDLSFEAIIKRIEIFKPDIIFIRENFNSENLIAIEDYCKLKKIDLETYNNFLYEISNQNKFTNDLNCEDLIEYKSIPNVKISNNDDLFCLFTSGSTGKPKAIWHSYISYLVYAHYTFKKYFLDSGASKGIFCATDAAWINGHTYAVYGPLITSTRTIFVNSLNALQNPKYLELFLEKTKPSFFYSSVTLLRAIRSMAKITNFKKINKQNSNIIGLGSCGEPLADEVGKWAINFFSTTNKHIVNTYFQTETGGVITAPLKEQGLTDNYSTVGKSKFPVEIIIDKSSGSLSIKNPWPGCFSKVTSDKKTDYWGDHNFFKLHDQGYCDEKSFLFIGGRTDDVINISGHRISTAEIESCCIGSSFDIDEAAAVGVSDEISGTKIVLFCVTQKKILNNSEKLKNFLKKQLTAFHRPWKVIYISVLPKTKSGKIARRLLRKVCLKNFDFVNEDLSTIMNHKKFLLALRDIGLYK